MAISTPAYAAGAVLVVCCCVYGITTVISLSCAGKSNWSCAKNAGIVACVTACFGAGLAFASYKLSASPRAM